MAQSVSTAPATTDAALSRHPIGLAILFLTEMWERFGFYTMLATFTLYVMDTKQDGLGWQDASGIYSWYMMFVYASPLIGGLLADRKLGYRLSIILGAIFFIAGYGLLTVRSEPILYLALTLLVIGNGFFKPNISTLVGNLYPPGSPLRDSAYNIFYMGINVGAFLAPLVAEVLRARYGFRAAFGASAVGMSLGLVFFLLFQRYIVAADHARDEPEVDPLAPPRSKSALDLVPNWKRVGALLVIFTIVIVFWMSFHQNGLTMVEWADKSTDWKSSQVTSILIKIFTLGLVDGSNVSGVISNAINPFWIIVLSLPLVRFWGWMNSKGLEPSTPAKMAIGMMLTCVAFLILAAAGKAGGDEGLVSPWWLIASYAVISLAELMLSPMGLSLVSKVAPPHMKGLMMGGWFVATAIGNKLTMIGSLYNKWPHSSFWLLLAILSFIMGLVLFILLKPLKRAMPGV